MNVLAGLAEGVVDAVLERDDDPEQGPFAVALERYRSRGVPDEARSPWRGRTTTRHGPDATGILRKLDRDLLGGVVRYATGTPTTEEDVEAGGAEPLPTLAVVGAGGAMPSLELAADGTWHVAERAATGEARRAKDKTRASVPTLASRYPDRRPPDRY